MNPSTSSRSGPSQTIQSSAASNSDWGAFSNVPQQQDHLGDGDLLGSFDEENITLVHALPNETPQRSASTHSDLLTYDAWDLQSSARPPDPPAGPFHARDSEPIHITLPPRPSEIQADYAPPPRLSSRRLSQASRSAGPSSPPLVSGFGHDIVFHPSSSRGQEDAVSTMRRVRQNSTPHVKSSAPTGATDLPVWAAPQSQTSRSKLLNTLSTGAKIATKWKTVMDLVPPEKTELHNESPTPTALPIDVTHFTPFATPEQVAGSYVAPSGAPNFAPSSPIPLAASHPNMEWSGTTLIGRGPTTQQILSSHMADQLRTSLPPRRRLSRTWGLLFSLDQHGASLSTLYRLINKYAESHRSSGNVLVGRDGHNGIFGVYMGEAITKKEGTYYGSGESFLFKAASDQESLRIFHWTGRNQYFALCESDFISFGGGNGAYGLLLDSTFSQNSSATCPTYDNEVLGVPDSSRKESASAFECLGLEVWGIEQ